MASDQGRSNQEVRDELANASGVDPSQITDAQIAAAKEAPSSGGGDIPAFLQPTVRGVEQLFAGPPSLYGGSNKPQAATGNVGGGEVQLAHPKQERAEIKAAEAKKKKAQQAAETLAQQKAQALAVQNSPWTQAANALAQSFESDLGALQPDISGASAPAAESSAASQAAGDLGLASESPGAAWLAQGATDAQAQTKGVQGAMNAEAQSYQNAGTAMANAVRGWGQGNALGVLTAPEDTWYNALQTHVQSNVNYYGGLAAGQIPEVEQMPSVVQAFQTQGGGVQGSGLTPLTDLSVGPGGQVSVKKAANSLERAVGNHDPRVGR